MQHTSPEPSHNSSRPSRFIRAFPSRIVAAVIYLMLIALVPAFADDDTFRRRFLRESVAAAAIDHPHILPVYDAGESEGVLCIA